MIGFFGSVTERNRTSSSSLARYSSIQLSSIRTLQTQLYDFSMHYLLLAITIYVRTFSCRLLYYTSIQLVQTDCLESQLCELVHVGVCMQSPMAYYILLYNYYGLLLLLIPLSVRCSFVERAGERANERTNVGASTHLTPAEKLSLSLLLLLLFLHCLASSGTVRQFLGERGRKRRRRASQLACQLEYICIALGQPCLLSQASKLSMLYVQFQAIARLL